jgi:hypothetical protein
MEILEAFGVSLIHHLSFFLFGVLGVANFVSTPSGLFELHVEFSSKSKWTSGLQVDFLGYFPPSPSGLRQLQVDFCQSPSGLSKKILDKFRFIW